MRWLLISESVPSALEFPHGYELIRTISTDLIADRRTRHSGARGKRSARRMDLLRRRMMAILRPACSARNDSVWVLRCYVGALRGSGQAKAPSSKIRQIIRKWNSDRGKKRRRRSVTSQAPPLLRQRKPYLTGSPPSRQERRCRQECRVVRV